MGVVILLALFSIGLYLQRRKQTNPVETNKGDVPSERIPASDGDASAVSNVETSPAVTLPFPTNSETISQHTNPDCEEAEVRTITLLLSGIYRSYVTTKASFLTFLLPYLQAVLIIGPVVLSSYTTDVAQVFHDEIVDTGSLGEHAEASATQSIARNLLKIATVSRAYRLAFPGHRLRYCHCNQDSGISGPLHMRMDD
ncbi:hypothetical protein ARMSODRAFT_1021981 [Armillaria solidipes]|uniref:ABC transmembrane type-1 domain-containing protein n=1 Tax=Armillaria solidipes TaxID=1076256 RepID=A0A2H3B8F5_9AGAR|nr:hypothetical protein ARMSODRAFT_1021981 [Armillaria solidipes]